LGKYEHKKNRITGKSKRSPAARDRWIVREFEYLRLIPEDLWDRTQRTMDEKSQSFQSSMEKHGIKSPNSLRHKEKRYLFSGLCICARCGGTMFIQPGGRERKTRHGRKEGQLWVIRNRTRLSCSNTRRGACDFHVNFRCDRLEEEFLSILKKQILAPEALNRIYLGIEKKIKSLKKKAYGDIDRINNEIVETYRELEGYRKALAKLNTSDFILENLKEAEDRLKSLTEHKKRYERDMRLETIQLDHKRVVAELENLHEILLERPQRANHILASILHEKIILDADNSTVRSKWDQVKKWAIIRLKRSGLVSDRDTIQSLDSDYVEFQIDVSTFKQ
ncbi:MAG: zinc ribbon domain-containing protein, partial [Deltaproteobacteria bacterium]